MNRYCIFLTDTETNEIVYAKEYGSEEEALIDIRDTASRRHHIHLFHNDTVDFLNKAAVIFNFAHEQCGQDADGAFEAVAFFEPHPEILTELAVCIKQDRFLPDGVAVSYGGETARSIYQSTTLGLIGSYRCLVHFKTDSVSAKENIKRFRIKATAGAE